MKLAYYNDGKEKSKSHELRFIEDDNFCKFIGNGAVNSHDISNLCGYGDSFDEAKYDLINQLDWLISELEAVMSLIDVAQVVNVDCCGKEVD